MTKKLRPNINLDDTKNILFSKYLKKNLPLLNTNIILCCPSNIFVTVWQHSSPNLNVKRLAILLVVLLVYIFVSQRTKTKMSCFICDLRTPESHKILRTMTSYRGVPLYNLLYDFISKYFDVEVDDEDMVCTTCCALLDALDRLRCELDNVEQMLQLQITRKYKLSEANRMCRLDERTAKLFRRGVNRRFACVQCLFEVDFADCLLPHSWFHDQKIDLINNCVETWFDCSLATNDCADCTLSFGTNAILQSHLREFHADSEPIFDASDVQLNIDADSENDESINYVYEGDTTCNDTIENATTNDLLRCDVSCN